MCVFKSSGTSGRLSTDNISATTALVWLEGFKVSGRESGVLVRLLISKPEGFCCKDVGRGRGWDATGPAEEAEIFDC